MNTRRIQHYKSSEKILLVGEGDFAFAACLAKAFRSAHNMIATSLDSRGELVQKYSCVERNLTELEERGCLMLHEVDVDDMNEHQTLTNMTFDVIIFNFPHSGHGYGLSETSRIMIQRHKNLLRGFFKSAREMLREGGEIHVTHRDDGPYCKWDLENIALETGLALKEKAAFAIENYPGYVNKRGSMTHANKTFPLGPCPLTFKFHLKNFFLDDFIVAGDDYRSLMKRLASFGLM